MKIRTFEGYGDVRKERKFWRGMRWAHNGYWSIKPLMRYFLRQDDKVQLTQRLHDRMHGIIMQAIKI